METTIKVTDLTHDDLVNILSTALYGCDWILTDYDAEVYEHIKELGRTQGECFEDKLADILLNGGTIKLIDLYAEGERYGILGDFLSDMEAKEYDLDNECVMYKVSIYDFYEGCSKGYKYAKTLLEDEEGDYFTANNLLQIIMFGEIIYG